jgi:hypothetical protein
MTTVTDSLRLSMIMLSNVDTANGTTTRCAPSHLSVRETKGIEFQLLHVLILFNFSVAKSTFINRRQKSELLQGRIFQKKKILLFFSES